MKVENPYQISLANFFIYNLEYGQKEGREAEKIFYYYPQEEVIEKQIRLVGFCAGVVKFTEIFNQSKPCEFVHTEKVRMILFQIDKNFWMVMGLHVPVSPTDKKVYENDQISDSVYMSVLKQSYNYFRLFNGNMDDSLKSLGPEKLKENLKIFFDNYIQSKLNIQDCDIMSTFNGLHFMSLERSIYLKIQCVLNILEENISLIEKTIVMHNDQVIWSGLEQEDLSLIYKHLKELVNLNNTKMSSTSQYAASTAAKFLISDSIKKRLTSDSNDSPTTSSAATANTQVTDDNQNNYYEFEKVYLGKTLESFYLIPYNLNKLTVFIFIRVSQQFKLSVLNKIDEILGSNMVNILKDIAEKQRNLASQEEKEIKYIYFNRLNLAQKSTLQMNGKETPKYIINLISQLSKDLENCRPTGEIFVKSGKDYWIACKKSDLREVYVICCVSKFLPICSRLSIRLKLLILADLQPFQISF